MRSVFAFCGGVVLPPVLGIVWVLVINGGQFAYPLAGPYVHMAMADQILRGHYGITPGVPASPSSTILYPYLLALLAPLHLGVFTSLVPCLAATAAS